MRRRWSWVRCEVPACLHKLGVRYIRRDRAAVVWCWWYAWLTGDRKRHRLCYRCARKLARS